MDSEVLYVLQASANRVALENSSAAADDSVLQAHAQAVLQDNPQQIMQSLQNSEKSDASSNRGTGSALPITNGAGAVTEWHCALLVRAALFLRANCAALRKAERSDQAQQERARLADQNAALGTVCTLIHSIAHQCSHPHDLCFFVLTVVCRTRRACLQWWASLWVPTLQC